MDKENMNAWKNLLEQDKRKGEIYDEKIKKDERNNDREENDDQDEEKGARERLGSGEEFLTCQPNQKLTHDEKKKVINSVKLTKALVLLGYNCWSELEPESKQEVEGYVEKALKLRIEKKIQEIEDYRKSTIFAKTINNELHDKMVDAEKKRSDALYKDLPSEFFDNDDISDLNSFLKQTNSKGKKKKRDSSNTLQVPGLQSRRNSNQILQAQGVQRRRSSVGIGLAAPIAFLEYDEVNAKLQIKAFREAFKILMIEFQKRKEYRVKRKAAKLKAKNRILAAWAFRKKQEDAKKLNAGEAEKKEWPEKSSGLHHTKKGLSDAKVEDKKDETKEDNEEEKNDNPINEDNSKSERDSSERNEHETAIKEVKCEMTNEKNVENTQKRNFVLVDFRKDRLNIKKNQRKADNKYYLDNRKEGWTKEDHLTNAQSNLKRVQMQHRIRNNLEVTEDDVEEKTIRKVPKFKDVVLKIMRINAVHNAFRVRKVSTNEKELEEDKGECNEEENDDVFNKERINDTAKNVMQSFNINSIKTPKSGRRNRSWTSVKEKKHSSSQSKQRLLSVPSAPQLSSFEKRQSTGKLRLTKNKWPSPKPPAKGSIQRSPSKKLPLTSQPSILPDTTNVQKTDEYVNPEQEEQEAKREENAREKKKKDEEMKWNMLKKKFGEQAAEETKNRWLQLAEEEKIYQEKKRLEEEKEKLREEKLANILAIENEDYYGEIDDVFEDQSLSDTDSSVSCLLDDADLEDFEKDFEKNTMKSIARDVRDHFNSVSDGL